MDYSFILPYMRRCITHPWFALVSRSQTAIFPTLFHYDVIGRQNRTYAYTCACPHPATSLPVVVIVLCVLQRLWKIGPALLDVRLFCRPMMS